MPRKMNCERRYFLKLVEGKSFWGDRPQAGNALCLETSWGWKELWVGFYSWLDTPEKKIHGFRLEMALGWKPPWAGNNFRLEAALAWKQLQAGSNLRLETALGWKQLQAGSNLTLETALGWKRCRAYVCLENLLESTRANLNTNVGLRTKRKTDCLCVLRHEMSARHLSKPKPLRTSFFP